MIGMINPDMSLIPGATRQYPFGPSIKEFEKLFSTSTAKGHLLKWLQESLSFEASFNVEVDNSTVSCLVLDLLVYHPGKIKPGSTDNGWVSLLKWAAKMCKLQYEVAMGTYDTSRKKNCDSFLRASSAL